MTDKDRNVANIDIDAIMATEGGRKVMYTLLEYTGVFRSTFDKDTHQHAFNAGKRQVGLYLVDELKEAAPDKFNRMMEEQND